MDLKFRIQGREVQVEWENRTAVSAIMNKLSTLKRLTLTKNGIRQICNIGIPVPRNDRNITTKPGDIAYEGGNLVIFLGEETVSCTKLGHMRGVSESQVKNMLAPMSLKFELYEG